MNNERINEQIKYHAESGARPDFADLLRRIEEDCGRSTAPQMTVSGSKAGRMIGVAAGIVAVTAVSAMTIVGLSSGMAKESEAAPEMWADITVSEDTSDGFYYTESESAPAAPGETVDEDMNGAVSDNEPAVSSGDVSDSDVSDSDVSDSDVSDTDAGGEE